MKNDGVEIENVGIKSENDGVELENDGVESEKSDCAAKTMYDRRNRVPPCQPAILIFLSVRAQYAGLCLCVIHILAPQKVGDSGAYFCRTHRF